MKALLFNYRCAECNIITKAPGLPDMAYGEFIMFNSSGESVYLNAITDIVFNEFRALIKEAYKTYNEITEENSSDILQAAFSITCDLSTDGSRYSITAFPTCKGCGSKNMASWGPTNPAEFTDDIKSPTHEAWNKLSCAEKKVKVEEAIKQVLVSGEI